MNDRYKIDKDYIKRLARNRWFELFNALIPEQAEVWAKSTRKHGKSYAASPCPVCRDGTDRFGFLPDGNESGAAYCRSCGAFPDGLDLISKYKRCSFYQALNNVSAYLHGVPVAVKSNEYDRHDTTSNKLSAVRRVIESCGEPVDAHLSYWRGRGLKPVLNNPSVLYSKGIAYYVDGKPLIKNGKWLTYPAIIGRMSNAQGWCGIQQIYLTKDGSKAGAEIEQELKARGINAKASSKRMLGVVKGGAVRLGKAGRVLAVCEGLETAVSIAQAADFWAIAAAGTASNLINIDIPKQVERLVIFADKDRSGAGEYAANALKSRVSARIDVEILLPRGEIEEARKGVDFLDSLAIGGSRDLVDVLSALEK